MPLERKKAALYVLLIFLCGFLAGALASNLLRSWDPWSRRTRADSPIAQSEVPRTSRRAVDSFTRRLDLRPEQAAQLHKILDETRLAYREHELEIEAIRQQSRTRIRSILEDEQKAKFDKMVALRDQKRKRRE